MKITCIICNRYKEGHAVRHWKDTQHCYSLHLETQRVWDYVGDTYVHRLNQSKSDEKHAKMRSKCSAVGDNSVNCTCSDDSGISSAVLSSRIEAVSLCNTKFFIEFFFFSCTSSFHDLFFLFGLHINFCNRLSMNTIGSLQANLKAKNRYSIILFSLKSYCCSFFLFPESAYNSFLMDSIMKLYF